MYESLDDIITHSGIYDFQLHYDTNYGIDKRTGWSCIINQSVLSEFQPTAGLAVNLALQAHAEIQSDLSFEGV